MLVSDSKKQYAEKFIAFRTAETQNTRPGLKNRFAIYGAACRNQILLAEVLRA